MYYGYPYYPYEIYTHGVERRKPEDVQANYLNIAEEVQRRIVNIDERFARIEKLIKERLRNNP